MTNNKLLIIIILIALATRLFSLADFPKGFSGDEAQQAYSAYSILKTGKDEWGQLLPINPRGFGDYKPPIQTYLMIPSIAIFGLNEFAARLPAAIAGILLVLVLYFLTLELFQDTQIALWSSFILAISPWHIQLSRTAFEGGVGILFFSLGLLFYLKSLKNIKLLIPTLIFFGLTLYSYHSLRLFLFLFICGLLLSKRNRDLFIKSKSIIYWILIGIFALPLILNFKTILIRASDVSITNSTVIAGYFENKGTSSLPKEIDKLIDNKFWFIGEHFLDNYLSYYSPIFYFTGQRSDGSYLNFPFYPLLYPLELVLWLLAGYELFYKKRRNYQILGIWILVAAIPAATAQGSMIVHRAVTFLPMVSIISGLGAKKLVEILKEKFPKYKSYPQVLLVIILSINFIFFLHFYIFNLPKKNTGTIRSEYKPVFNEILKQQHSYDRIIISKSFTEPQIFIAFYGKIDPSTFQAASQDWLRYERTGAKYVDQMESWNLGNFLFEGIDWKNKDGKRPNALIVGDTKDFPEDSNSILDVKNPRGIVIYRLVPSVYAK